MDDFATRCQRVVAALVSQRVPLIYRESINGRFVSVTTAAGIPVLTVSREVAVDAGIGLQRLRTEPQTNLPSPAIGDARDERGVSHREVCMPSVEPVRWAHPDTASDALKPLLDLCGGRVENVIVQRWCNPHFPPRHRERYVMAEYVIRNGTGVFIDAVSRRLLYPSGWILARV